MITQKSAWHLTHHLRESLGESFSSMLKRVHDGTFHKMSPKHLNRYVQEFSGKYKLRELDTLLQMPDMVHQMVDKRLKYSDLIRDNGLDNTARA